MRAPPPTPAAAKSEEPTRRDVIQAEVDGGVEDGKREALLRWALGLELEQERDLAAAVKSHLAAYNLNPEFRLPLRALVRIFTRRRSFKNLRRLLEASVQASSTVHERASAMLDLAHFLEHHADDTRAAREWVDKALEEDGASRYGAFALERAARSDADGAALIRALELRVELAESPVLRGLLLHDLAWAREREGDIDGAMEDLESAAALPAVRWRSFAVLERIARRHERAAELARALEALGELALAVARGEDTEGSGAFRIERFADERRAGGEAAALFYEAAFLHLQLGEAPQAIALLGKAAALRPADVFIADAHVRALRAGREGARIVEVADRLAGQVPAEVEAGWRYEAAASLQSSDPTRARAELRRAEGLAPESSAIAATKAEWLRSGGFVLEWIDSLERASGLAPLASPAS
ncbi:MAG: hypothetical protein AAF411_26215, partial [Myxococcota bacterium]